MELEDALRWQRSASHSDILAHARTAAAAFRDGEFEIRFHACSDLPRRGEEPRALLSRFPAQSSPEHRLRVVCLPFVFSIGRCRTQPTVVGWPRQFCVFSPAGRVQLQLRCCRCATIHQPWRVWCKSTAQLTALDFRSRAGKRKDSAYLAHIVKIDLSSEASLSEFRRQWSSLGPTRRSFLDP